MGGRKKEDYYCKMCPQNNWNGKMRHHAIDWEVQTMHAPLAPLSNLGLTFPLPGIWISPWALLSSLDLASPQWGLDAMFCTLSLATSWCVVEGILSSLLCYQNEWSLTKDCILSLYDIFFFHAVNQLIVLTFSKLFGYLSAGLHYHDKSI